MRTLEKSCPLQIMEIIATSNLLDTSMVWKFDGSQLPTFWTLPWYGNLMEVNFQPFGHFQWYGNLMEVNFQPFGHFHCIEICWKSTSNLLDTSMVWNFLGNLLEVKISMMWRRHDFSSEGLNFFTAMPYSHSFASHYRDSCSSPTGFAVLCEFESRSSVLSCVSSVFSGFFALPRYSKRSHQLYSV